jgi:hypothetical protein
MWAGKLGRGFSMSDLLKYGALALGAYFLWDKLAPTIMGVIPQTPNATGTPAQNTVPTTPSGSTPIRIMLQEAANKAGEPGPNSFDVWNYYYQAVRGVSGPPWEATEASKLDRGYKYTVDEYLALTVPKGFGGIIANAYESADKRMVQ